MSQDFEIDGQRVPPGERRTFELPVARLYTDTSLTMPVRVIRGRRDGPTLFLSAAIHGDELNGVEIVHRVLRHPRVKSLRGTLIAVPVVNVFGFISRSRYLPDRRDLNRSFPGSTKGSTAARLAHLFVQEIVDRSDYGIDLHTGALQRTNLPQIRTRVDDETSLRLARAFRPPLIMSSDLKDGSLREHASERGVPVLLYEAGEALRFSEVAIRTGVSGILGVMEEIGMLARRGGRKRVVTEPVVARESYWLRAPEGGVLRGGPRLGAWVHKGDVVAHVGDPLGEDVHPVISPHDGIVIGATTSPLVNEGDALYHVAKPQRPGDAQARIQELVPDVEDAPDMGQMPSPPNGRT